MTTKPEYPSAIDHLVLPTRSLERARMRLSSLGFTVAADALHPFGTENACVFFANDTYLEPLAVASREDCEAASRAGNAFVGRHQAFRFRRDEGLSAIVLKTTDADADHRLFLREGMSGGDRLDFSRLMRFPDGREVNVAFRLAFAADLRAPDFFLFTCQRVNAVSVDRAALTDHENGVTGIARTVLVEDNPSDFQYFLEMGLKQRMVTANSFGLSIEAANAAVDILSPVGFQAAFGLSAIPEGRGLIGSAIVFASRDLKVTAACLAANGIACEIIGARLVVAPQPGQGVAFAFEETA